MFARTASRVIRSARQFSTVARTATATQLVSNKAIAVVASVVAVAAFTVQPVLAATIPAEGIPGTNAERTFIAIKPDGVDRQLVGKIISRFEEKGFQLVAIKLIHPTPALAAGHYDDLKAKPFFPSLVKYFSSGPIVAMVWQGKGAILTGRKILGATNPADSAPGTIRGDFCIDVGRNIIHGSDAADSAKHEINFWFTPAELTYVESTQAKMLYEKP